MKLSRRDLAKTLIFGSSLRLNAWQEAPLFSADVHLVNLSLTVRDNEGRVVTDLEKDEFVVSESGKRQTIQHFSRQAELPLTVGLLIDSSASMNEELQDIRRASIQFLGKVMRERDQAFLVRFDSRAELLQPLTTSFMSVRKALEGLSVSIPQRPTLLRRLVSGRRDSRREPSTVLFDAVPLASQDVLSATPGRKALLVFSDGVDGGSQSSQAVAIESAQRADVSIYCLRFSQFLAGWERFENEGKRALQQMSSETGGGYFDMSERSIEEVFQTIETELRNEYTIGYAPDDKFAGYHEISASVTRDFHRVRTRAGYYFE